MECKVIREMLTAYHDGELADEVVRNIEEHATICHLCRKGDLELNDAWHILEMWEDIDPPGKIRMEVLSHIATQRKMRWAKFVIPVAAAAIVIVVSLVFRFAGLQHEKQNQMPLPALPMQLTAQHLDFNEDELIANLHVLRDEEFYDTMEELVNIDYLPLIDDPKQMERDRQRSSLDAALT